jgi:hypothetical protein
MTRAALSISGKPGCLEAAAALAAGACEIMRRMPEDRAGGGEGNTDAGPPAGGGEGNTDAGPPAGGGEGDTGVVPPAGGSPADGNDGGAGCMTADAGADRRALLREKEFALKVLAASRGALARLPGRNPDSPFPAPAYRLRTALFPDTQPPPGAGPGPDELRRALAAAVRDGAGSREALEIRSRLGEAVADAEAWAMASVTTLVHDPSGPVRDSRHSGDSGDSGNSGNYGTGPGARAAGARGEESAEELLRSAHEGLEALLGRTHPETLYALERLARHLAGGSGPGTPPLPFQHEFPPAASRYEAEQKFMSAADAWAEAGAGAGEGAASARLRGWAPPELPQDFVRRLALLRSSGDGKALAATAAAAGCAVFRHVTRDEASFFTEAGKAAADVLGPGHPTSVKFLNCLGHITYFRDEKGQSRRFFQQAADALARMPGAPAAELVTASISLMRSRNIAEDGTSALADCVGALDAVEETEPGVAGAPGAAPSRALPPARAGRDRLLARHWLAEVLYLLDDHRSAANVLAPLLDSLTRHLEDGGTGRWTWPPCLAGSALLVAGETELRLGDGARAEAFLRRSLDVLHRGQAGPAILMPTVRTLRSILESRGDGEALREAAQLSELEAVLLLSTEGPDSPSVIEAILLAARLHERSGDADAALGLHRRVLAARKRLLGPMAQETRQSRKEIRRIEGRKR